MAKSSRAKSPTIRKRPGKVAPKAPASIAIRIDSQGDVLMHLPTSTLDDVFEVGRRVKFRKGLKVEAIDAVVSKAVASRRAQK